MKEFIESGLKFSFDANWDVVQYDKLNEYRVVCNNLQGTKAIDFLAFYESTMLMFEIKNFRGHGERHYYNQRLTNSMDQLTTEVAHKVKDTIAVLTGIGRSTPKEDSIWKKAHKHLNSKKQIMVIAWIEEELSNPVLKKRKKGEMSTRTDKLKKKLSWLTTNISIDNVKERHFNFEGFEVMPYNA